MDVLNRRNLGELACFSLGSNLGHRRDNLDSAILSIEAALGNTSRRSSLYESEPWGFHSEHAFLNCCIVVPCHLEAKDLLRKILRIESEMGRIRKKAGYSDRSIDIDLLIYGDLILNEPDIVIPHPRMHLRRFVLQPLAEIYPDLCHPVLDSTIEDLLLSCPDRSELRVL